MITHPSVVLTNVGKRYGMMWAIEDLSLTIEEAELALIVGPNGAGKSTMLKVIAGVIEPTKGEISLFRESMRPSNAEARKWLGVLLHESFLYDELTVRENLEFFHSIYRGNQKMSWWKIIDSLDIARVLGSKASELSYGWRRRVDIARALIHHPRIVLFDELFSGLDSSVCQLMTKEIIPEVLAEGTTVIVASHIGRYLDGMWHHRIRLNAGRVDSVEGRGHVES